MRLRTRYSISMVLLISIVVTFMSTVLLFQFNESARVQQNVSTDAISEAIIVQMMKRGASLSDYFAIHLVNDIYFENQQEISDALQASLKQKDLLYVEIFDPNGYIINDGSDELWAFGEEVNDIKMLQAIQKSDQLYSRIEKDKVIFARNIKIGDEIIAGVHLAFSLVYINEDILKMKNTLQKELDTISVKDFQKHIYIVFGVSSMLLGIGIIMAIFTANRLTKPIHLLAQYAQKVGEGKHMKKLQLNRSDELGQLATTFNKMNYRLLKNKGEINYQAFHDHLTGLPNRNMFHKYLDKTLKQATYKEQHVAVFFLDLDGFKAVNDSLGHEAGDKLLVIIAEQFNSVIRKQDIMNVKDHPNNMLVARIGGDEFTIVLQNMTQKKVISQIATRVIKSIDAPLIINGQQVNISVSIGISIYPDDGIDGDTLLKNADNAMYQAKAKGKGCYAFFDNC